MTTDAYSRIKTYCEDLSTRIRLVDEWKLRHPDYKTRQFEIDHRAWYKSEDDTELTFESSFDPNDLMPETSDIITAQRLNDIMLITLAAYEKPLHDESKGSYALRPEDTLVINVPMNTDSDICRDLAENVPEHIKGRVVVVRSGS